MSHIWPFWTLLILCVIIQILHICFTQFLRDYSDFTHRFYSVFCVISQILHIGFTQFLHDS